MKSLIRALGLFLTVSLAATAKADVVKEGIALELAFIKRIFEVGYAPTVWKKQTFNWDLGAEYQKAKDTLDQKTTVSALEYRQLVGGLLNSTRDYHVGYQFLSTEASRLPFGVYSNAGKTYIVWIDTTKLSPETFPFKEGDELVSWNGRPIEEVMIELREAAKVSVEGTDSRIADLLLTSRRAARGLVVPQGRVDLVVKRIATGQLIARQLTWEYIPETIEWNPDAAVMAPLAVGSYDGNDFLRPQMTWGLAKEFQADVSATVGAQNWQIGGRNSFLPRFGKPVWENAASAKFDAYIYEDGGKKIGYVRVPSYGESTEAFVAFREIIKKYQAETDALVIDQVNNPGGSVMYVMALMTVLSDQPIKVPPHHIALWPAMVQRALTLRNELAPVTNDMSAKMLMGADLDGYPVNFQMVQSIRDYVRDVDVAWKNKERVTKPLYLFGVDKVNPDPEVNYTKPILVLTNELDFSGGDFFPGILQDNGRAKIFGARTAGAGGYVVNVTFPSGLGLEAFQFTGSLARRVNGQPLENLGVTPDYPYTLTEKDFTDSFSDYKAAVNKTLAEMLK